MVDFIMRPSEWPTDPRYHGTSSPYLATMLAAIMGTILASLGLLQLGFLVNFISSYVKKSTCITLKQSSFFRSVVAGFIQAAAFTIPLGQLKKIFGVHVDGQTFFTKAGFQNCVSGLLSRSFENVSKIYQILKELFDGNANWYDFTIGIISILLLVGLKELKKRAKDYDSLRKGFNGFMVLLIFLRLKISTR